MRLALLLTMLLLVLQVVEGMDRPLKEIPASEIITKIQNGQPVVYDHVIITGNLSLWQSSNPLIHHPVTKEWHLGLNVYNITKDTYISGLSRNKKTVRVPIRINDSKIEGSVEFNNIIFQSPTLQLSNTEIIGNALFSGSEFKNNVDFSGSRFNSPADFSLSRFNKSANFKRSKFYNLSFFSGSQFNGETDFSSILFNKAPVFPATQFERYVNFNESSFQYIDFHYSQFNGTGNFIKCHFN